MGLGSGRCCPGVADVSFVQAAVVAVRGCWLGSLPRGVQI